MFDEKKVFALWLFFMVISIVINVGILAFIGWVIIKVMQHFGVM